MSAVCSKVQGGESLFILRVGISRLLKQLFERHWIVPPTCGDNLFILFFIARPKFKEQNLELHGFCPKHLINSSSSTCCEPSSEKNLCLNLMPSFAANMDFKALADVPSTSAMSAIQRCTRGIGCTPPLLPGLTPWESRLGFSMCFWDHLSYQYHMTSWPTSQIPCRKKKKRNLSWWT